MGTSARARNPTGQRPRLRLAPACRRHFDSPVLTGWRGCRPSPGNGTYSSQPRCGPRGGRRVGPAIARAGAAIGRDVSAEPRERRGPQLFRGVRRVGLGLDSVAPPAHGEPKRPGARPPTGCRPCSIEPWRRTSLAPHSLRAWPSEAAEQTEQLLRRCSVPRAATGGKGRPWATPPTRRSPQLAGIFGSRRDPSRTLR
jgi:hypothetical protein